MTTRLLDDEKYIKTKIKTYKDSISTNFWESKNYIDKELKSESDSDSDSESNSDSDCNSDSNSNTNNE